MIDPIKEEELEEMHRVFAARADADDKRTAMRLARFAEAKVKVAWERQEKAHQQSSNGSAETLLFIGMVIASIAAGYLYGEPIGWLTFGLLLIAGGVSMLIARHSK